MTIYRKLFLIASFAAVPFTSVLAQAKFALIEPLSGPFANIGEQTLRITKEAVAESNRKSSLPGGEKIELFEFDSKNSPQEAFSALQAAIDKGARYIVQGSSSAVAAALIDAIDKHNLRNPDKEVLFLNVAALDPDLTDAKCSFWHFRFLGNTDMRMEAIVSSIEKDKALKNVYIIGQDYAHGKQVSKAAKEKLAARRPDIKIGGDDLHPLGKVKDFSPYIAKIKAAGSDAVITGNHGSDLVLLVKAAKDAGLKLKFYTYFANFPGTPTALGSDAADRVFLVNDWHPNVSPNRYEQFSTEFTKKYGADVGGVGPIVAIEMAVRAMNQAGSTKPFKVALALEDLQINGDQGSLVMRKADHQLLAPIYVSVFTKSDAASVKHQTENSGYGFKTVSVFQPNGTNAGTTCAMKRPAL